MSTIAIIGRMLLALVLVLGVMWALARWARKPMGVGKGERVMTVLARQQLSRSSSVTVLKLMDRALVLGVTEQGVQLLTEAELAPIEQALTVSATPRRRAAEPALAAETVSGLPARPALPAALPGGLDGSILSPGTWKQLLGAAREMTVRR
ncbi:MAG: flagellar biosynthetic protein FliO [Jatrophihabitantaceae bacterium]